MRGAALYAAALSGMVLAIVHPPLRWPAHAPAEAAGVVGGLQQTAMNTGPVAGIAAAAAVVGYGTPAALLAMAAFAVAGAVVATRLPARSPAPALG